MTAFRKKCWYVAAITIAKDAEHALELANDSEFGLSATILPLTKHRPDRWRHVWNAVGCLSMVIVPATRSEVALWWREKVALVVAFPFRLTRIL